MTPIHVVALFGPETPALFAARSPNATALWAGIACSPCVNAYNNRQSVCRNNLCMQAITVDDVFKEVTRIYDSLKKDDIRKLICGMINVPTHRSRQFRFAALGIILLTVAIRLPSLLHPLPIDDEARYSVIANEIVDGGRPYIDAVDRKPPLLFWTYAAAFKVAGELQLDRAAHSFATLDARHNGRAICNRKTTVRSRNRSNCRASFTVCFNLGASFKNLAFNGEMVMNLAIVWAWAIAIQTRVRREWRPELC